MDRRASDNEFVKSKTTEFFPRRGESHDGDLLNLPIAVTPDNLSNKHKPTSAYYGIDSADASPNNRSDMMNSPMFMNTPVQTPGGATFDIRQKNRVLIVPQPANGTQQRVLTSTNSVAESYNIMSAHSPVECMPETSVYIYVEDLIIATNSELTGRSFDESLNKQRYQELKAEYNPVFVTTMADMEEQYTGILQQHWSTAFEGTVKLKTIKELVEDTRKSSVRVAMSDELFFKQSPNYRSELMASGSLLLFASLFTRNENWQGINYSKVPAGRGASNIFCKLNFSHLRDRKLIGLFIESKYFTPKLVQLFTDNESVCFVPALFNEVPNIEFDFLFQRVNQYKSKILMKNDPDAKKIFDNYMQYEDKSKNCVFIDRYDCAKVMMYRSEFMEVLKEHCHLENNRLDGNHFQIPWTRSGDYLDCLNNINVDSMITKLCNSIPYPLITKSDLACGDKSTHSFMIIKEQPEDWPDLKEKIFKQYHGKPFILQSYFSGQRNIVIKSMFFLGEFTYDVSKGLNDEAKDPKLHTGEFIKQNSKSVLQKKTVGSSIECAESPNIDDRQNVNSIPQSPISTNTVLTHDVIEKIKHFTVTLADKMRLNMVGIDFLVDTTKYPKRIIPIDLNKMPRPENIPRFREQLMKLCLQPSSHIEIGPMK